MFLFQFSLCIYINKQTVKEIDNQVCVARARHGERGRGSERDTQEGETEKGGEGGLIN